MIQVIRLNTSTTIRSLFPAVPLVVIAWILLLASVSVLGDRAPAFVVMFPSDQLLSNLPESARVVDANQWTLTLTGDSSGFALELYRRGAYLVLPAGLKGCFTRV